MKTRRRFSPEFKKQAIEMVENGRPAPEVAVELEIAASCLYSWIRQAYPLEVQVVEPAVANDKESEELIRLRREVAHLRRENDILKKAAIILGTDPLFRTEK